MFLKYLSQRDKEYNKTLDDIVNKIDIISSQNNDSLNRVRDEFLGEIKEGRNQNQSIVNTLFSISKETIETMSSLSSRVGELGEAVKELRQKIGNGH